MPTTTVTAVYNVLEGTEGDDIIYGLTINDGNFLYGYGGNDTLYGNKGDDTLDGGTGADTMYGSVGNDTYLVDNVGDKVIEYANEGIDAVAASITYTLPDNVEHLLLTGNDLNNSLLLRTIGTTNINGTGNGLNNTLIGNSGNNILNGGAGDDIIYGGEGNDVLYGGAGNDCLDGELFPNVQFKSPNWYIFDSKNIGGIILAGQHTGGTESSVVSRYGADTMYGGYGDDCYFVDNAGDKVVEYAGQGYDRVYAGINYTLPANVEFLWLMDSFDINGTGNSLNNYMVGNEGKNLLNGGAGNDTLVGQGGNDTLWGGAGNDVLSGGTGTDVMAGGTGNDWYSVDNIGDKVIENAGEGRDKVNAIVSFVLPANVEYLVLSGAANINGTGNNLNNAISGNGGNNILSGRAGNDILNGGAGNDILMGGGGNDILTGGTGADTFVFQSMLHGVDTITDFVSGEDRLQLAQAELGGLLTEMRSNGGSLSAGRFVANNTGVATNASQRIIYNLKTGALYYDADGSGQGVAVQFATLGNKPANLKAGDFFAAAS